MHEHRKLIDLDIRNAPGLTKGGVASCAGLSDLFSSRATSITELGKNSLCDNFSQFSIFPNLSNFVKMLRKV